MPTPPPPPQTPSAPSPPPLLIALSGPTSSGKTTLATALRYIFSPPHYPSPPVVIHQDDFYKTDEQIPLTERGVQDWDCVDAVEWGALRGVLRDVRGEKGGPTQDGERVRQGNFEGEVDVDIDGVHGVKGIGEGVLRASSEEVGNWDAALKTRRIVIVDGFLLLGENVSAEIRGLFDVKILLRAGYQEAKERRERRNGYVTLEGFWQDPEGYFDEVVWPGYVREHKWLFERGDVEGRVKGEVLGREGVWVGDVGWGLETAVGWVVGVVKEGLERGKGGG